jgi:hypothetical protein
VLRRLLPLLPAVALAGCGGSAPALDQASTADTRPPPAYAQIVAAFGEHGEELRVEPDLTGDDFAISFARPWLPRPVVLLGRRDGDGNIMVYVYRSPADAAAVAAVPRAELVFRPAWKLLQRANVLVITVAEGPRRDRIAAALDELAGK